MSAFAKRPGRLLDGMPYVPAAATDIRKTFARIKREMAERNKQPKVTPISKRKSA